MARRNLHIALGAAIVTAIAIVIALKKSGSHVECGPGFVARGTRCTGCPPPLVERAGTCDAPDLRVPVPETTLSIGPSDWEAEGRVAPRLLHTAPFWIDAFEATVAKVEGASADGARAASGLTRDEAAAYCASRGGRLPTEDEWIAAASGDRPRRYPWGDTGAVCRRGAWGLTAGPCAQGALGPDTVGAHPDGDTPTGIHDLAGNVAEWTAGDTGVGVVRGGSYRTSLATELRTWSRVEIRAASKGSDVGVRCAYDAAIGEANPGYPRRSP